MDFSERRAVLIFLEIQAVPMGFGNAVNVS